MKNTQFLERIELLKLVTRLKQILNEQGDVDATCETAGYFYRYTIASAWEDFQERVKHQKSLNSSSESNDHHAKENNGKSATTDGDVEMTESNGDKSANSSKFVAENFPFRQFFDNANDLFKGESLDDDLVKADACWQYIQQIFFKLAEFHAFELLRNGRERSDYLLVR